MISLEGVSKTYQLRNGETKKIMSNVTINIPPKNLGILGRNGAGKSTTLRMIAGIEDPDEGRIRRTVDVSWPIGFRGSFHRQLTGLENIRFVARMYGRDTEAVVDSVKDFAELGAFFTEPIKTYSSGMVARLAFGLSMAIDFEVYLIDELMSAGDARFKEKSKAVFHGKLAASKIIMVSHSMSTIREYCEAGIFLENGVLSYFDDINEAIETYEMSSLKPQALSNAP